MNKEKIIHALNNALTVIVGNLEILIETEKFDMDCCIAVRKGAARIVKIIDEMKED